MRVARRGGAVLRRALIAAGLLSPAVALADPITAVAALAPIIGGTAAAFVVTNAVAIAFVGMTIAGAIDARRKARRAAAAQRASYNAGLQDRSVTALNATPPWRINYGRFTAGGDIIDVLTSDKTVTKEFGTAGSQSQNKPDAYKHLIVHLATHEIEEIHEVYIDGVAVGALDENGWATSGSFGSSEKVGRMSTFTTTITLSEPVFAVLSCYETDAGSPWVHSDVTPVLSNGNLTVTVPTGKTVTFNYTVEQSKSVVRIRKFLGAETQSAQSYLQSIAPNTDSTDHHLRGLACVVITLDLEEPRFQGGSNQITVDRSGKKLFDPRTGQTVFSSNPALVIRDFLTAEYGYQCTSDDIDDEYTIAAANACDVTISLTTGSSTVNGATYTCNGMVTTDGGLEAQLEELCESMAGAAVYGARWMIMAGAWTPPVTLPGGGGLTDADLDGQIEIVQAGPGVDEMFNGCRGTFVPRGSAQPTDADPYQNATFLAADGRALWNDFTLPFTDDKARAKNLFRIFTEKARIAQVIRYPAKLRAWPLRVGDRIPVSSAEYSFVERIYRVTDWQFGITSPVLLTMELDAPEVWDQADAATSNLTQNADLPNPWVVGEIAGFAATSSVSTMVKSGITGSLVARVLLSWTAIVDSYVKNPPGYVEIQWRRAAQDFQRLTWPGDQAEAELLGVNHGDRLIIRARAVNGIGGIGPWSYIAHTVTGPTTLGSVELSPGAATEIFRAEDNSGFLGTSGNTHVNDILDIDVEVDCAATIIVEGEFLADNDPGASGLIIFSRFSPIWKINSGSWTTGTGSPAMQQIRMLSNSNQEHRFPLFASYTIDVTAGSTLSAGIFFVDHVSSQVTGELWAARTRVELVKR